MFNRVAAAVLALAAFVAVLETPPHMHPASQQ